MYKERRTVVNPAKRSSGQRRRASIKKSWGERRHWRLRASQSKADKKNQGPRYKESRAKSVYNPK